MNGWETINEKPSGSPAEQIAVIILSLLAGSIILVYFRRRSDVKTIDNDGISGSSAI
jgi:hypothetical protein